MQRAWPERIPIPELVSLARVMSPQGFSMAKASKPVGRKATYGDQSVRQGNGGETHQSADDGYDILTTQQGAPVADDQNTLKEGARGPALLEDTHFREKIFHFDHERIPERVV